MKPESRSRTALSVTQSKAKMYEYNVPLEDHIDLKADPSRLFPLTIGMLGDLAAKINDGDATEEEILELRSSIPFSARFFDAFIEARLSPENDLYVRLLGSTAYYLCNLPGSSNILAERISKQTINLGTFGLENLLTWLLLIKDFPTPLSEFSDSPYREILNQISAVYIEFNNTGNRSGEIIGLANQLRAISYDIGSPRELLLADLIGAIIRKRIDNSTWVCLPKYTNLPLSEWEDAVKKDTFIKEFWPAQHLLGKQEVFQGKSAIVQMPTSAGKTKATEIIIRSAFLAKRTSLAVIIAPFRALCHEIRQGLLQAFQGESVNIDELSDVLQDDYSVERILRDLNVLVSTPEKFNYVLRHDANFAKNIGLIIYDEGHQFDNGSRGITFELLLTSLKSRIPETSQIILISAVINNAVQIGEWLIGDEAEIVKGASLSATFKSIGFTTMVKQFQSLQFVDSGDPEKKEFYVPRIFNQYTTRKYKRIFPKLDDGKEVALYLGLRLVNQGSVAIFCGKKESVNNLCETIEKIYRYGLDLQRPSSFANQNETLKLNNLYAANLGKDAVFTKSAELGVFAHHNNVPHGIRLAVEYAMKENLINFVICTSTLAQGVNLPIRYLIVTSVYQAGEKIKVRDFQNLIGRSGRSGMHTEGSILFADPEVYDEKKHWNDVKNMLDPSKSEDCDSSLLSLFEPLHNKYHSGQTEFDIFSLVSAYQQGRSAITTWVQEFVEKNPFENLAVRDVQRQINEKINVISAVESFLMANSNVNEDAINKDTVAELAKGTLAYFLADDDPKKQIEDLFVLLAETIETRIPSVVKRIVFGKTTFGVPDSIAISNWVNENIEVFNENKDGLDLFRVIWPIIADNIHNRNFVNCSLPESMTEMALLWLEGSAFHALFQQLKNSGAKKIAGSQEREYKIEHVVDVCENGFAYEGILVLGALIELIPETQVEDLDLLINNLKRLQKRLKYGLSNETSIVFYELGFADRVVAMDLSSLFEEVISAKDLAIQALKLQSEQVFAKLETYPSYFSEVYRNRVALVR